MSNYLTEILVCLNIKILKTNNISSKPMCIVYVGIFKFKVYIFVNENELFTHNGISRKNLSRFSKDYIYQNLHNIEFI